MKIAIVHDWLTTFAGAERVLEQMLICYPEADVFSLVDFLEEDQRSFLQGKAVRTSFIQHMPFARKRYRHYLPLMPIAVEQFDLRAYDLILSSSHAVAKGVITSPDQLHICMCYSPIRYGWDMQHQYMEESGLNKGVAGWFLRWLLHRLRVWDARTANGVDHFIAISNFIARRILKAYRRDAEVIYPPVDLQKFSLCSEKQEYYLTASRHVPYKKIPLIVEAFNAMPGQRLIVVGDGPDLFKSKALAGKNVEVLGYQSAEQLKSLLQHAKAFVFAAEEDFGLAPLEAQACGTPVIAYGKGGTLETIRGLSSVEPTGVFFSSQTAHDICEAVHEFERHKDRITPHACRRNAERFSQERFQQTLTCFVDTQWSRFSQFRRQGC